MRFPDAATSDLTAARQADKYRLYIEALQNPTADVSFFSALYEQMNGRSPVVIREDFCGTAAISCEWLRVSDSGRAIAVDIDPEPLRWCDDHLVPSLTPGQAGRLQLIVRDILGSELPGADVILAPNTSICLLRQRADVLRYLSACRVKLTPGGLCIMDLYAGPEAQRTGSDRVECEGFVCIWEQAEFNAVTNVALNRIHFEFPDGSRLIDAFVYEMRLWTPAELADALADAGFSDVRVYPRCTDPTIPEGARARPVERLDVTDQWEAYIVGFI